MKGVRKGAMGGHVGGFYRTLCKPCPSKWFLDSLAMPETHTHVLHLFLYLIPQVSRGAIERVLKGLSSWDHGCLWREVGMKLWKGNWQSCWFANQQSIKEMLSKKLTISCSDPVNCSYAFM